jgi:glycosyltransferase involved in cell wall biosynthesis
MLKRGNMRVLIAHNRYQQRGGEDNVVAAESELLRSHGHEVVGLEVDNDHISGALSQIAASFRSIYSFHGKHLVKKAIEDAKPDIVHFHNFFPTFSPAVFRACVEAEVPVVHTLHNYRIVCAAATLFRDGAVCEECITKRSIVPGIQHACYRSSHLGSAVSGVGMAVHGEMGTWSKKVSAYIALTNFAAGRLGSFRIPHEKIFVKPNFAIDRGVGGGKGSYALFVGRLSPEKGIQTLIDADAAHSLCMDVVILGDGPMRDEVQRATEVPGSRLIYKGFVGHDEALKYMMDARVLLVPSIWYEGFPLVIVEAFSLGLPIIGADLGNIASIIDRGETGLLYAAGDHRAFSSTLSEYADHPTLMTHMRLQTRRRYLETYTPEVNYKTLIEIYQSTIES